MVLSTRKQSIRRFLGAALPFLALSVLGVGLSAVALGAEEITQPPVVQPARWQVITPRTPRTPKRGPIIEGHTVGLFIDGGYCSGGPKPRFDHVRVVELPKTNARRFPAAVIYAYTVIPEYTYTPMPPSPPEYGGKCGHIRAAIFHKITTKRPAKGLRLFDGSGRKLEQVWPPPKP
jgi:hypothetical protein